MIRLAVAACLALAACKGDDRPRAPAEEEDDGPPPVPSPPPRDRAPRVPIRTTVEALVAEQMAARPRRLLTAIGDAARSRGLAVAGLGGLDDQALPGMLEPGDVLQPSDDRVVVFAGADRDGIHLIDPVRGPRVTDLVTFRLEFARGQALLVAASQADMDARWESLFPRPNRRR